jgi:hypothetical protein
VLTYNFNLRKYELINLESNVGAFMLTVLFLIYLVVTFTYYLFSTLAEYQPYVYSTLLFSHVTQTWCSEGEDRMKFFDEEF